MYDLGVGTPAGAHRTWPTAWPDSRRVTCSASHPTRQWWLAAIFVGNRSRRRRVRYTSREVSDRSRRMVDESAVRRDPCGHRVVNVAQPAVRATRSVVRRRQAAYVEGNPGMNLHRSQRRTTKSSGRALLGSRLADKNGAMAIDKRTTRLGVLGVGVDAADRRARYATCGSCRESRRRTFQARGLGRQTTRSVDSARTWPDLRRQGSDHGRQSAHPHSRHRLERDQEAEGSSRRCSIDCRVR